jgi:hypothetical protein
MPSENSFAVFGVAAAALTVAGCTDACGPHGDERSPAQSVARSGHPTPVSPVASSETGTTGATEQENPLILCVSSAGSSPVTAPLAARARELYAQVLQKDPSFAGGVPNGGGSDEQATRLQIEMVLVEHEEPVFHDTVLVEEGVQERSYRAASGDGSRTYRARYAFGHPSSIEILGPDFGVGCALAVRRSFSWASTPLGADSWRTLDYKATPLK